MRVSFIYLDLRRALAWTHFRPSGQLAASGAPDAITSAGPTPTARDSDPTTGSATDLGL
jgi:hypothetical protein